MLVHKEAILQVLNVSWCSSEVPPFLCMWQSSTVSPFEQIDISLKHNSGNYLHNTAAYPLLCKWMTL